MPFHSSAILVHNYSVCDNRRMDHDLNLIEVLDALLTENSVTKAAARLHTSAPAVSRSLARLRRAFGDPLLVRAGRDLGPPPPALGVRGEMPPPPPPAPRRV